MHASRTYGHYKKDSMRYGEYSRPYTASIRSHVAMQQLLNFCFSPLAGPGPDPLKTPQPDLGRTAYNRGPKRVLTAAKCMRTKSADNQAYGLMVV